MNPPIAQNRDRPICARGPALGKTSEQATDCDQPVYNSWNWYISRVKARPKA